MPVINTPVRVKTVLQLICSLLLLSPICRCHGQQLTAEYLDIKLPNRVYCLSTHYDGADRIYLFGNCASNDQRLLVFSISAETVEVLGSLPGVGHYTTAQGDDHGNIFYFGGGSNWNAVFKYDPITNSSSTVATPSFNIRGHTSFKLNSTTVGIIGGVGDPNRLWMFNMETATLSGDVSLPFPNVRGCSIRVGNKVYVFDDGGNGNQQALRLDLEHLQMKTVGPPTLPIFDYHPASVWKDQLIYLLGGYSSTQGHRTDGLIQFDPVTYENRFIPVAHLPVNNTAYLHHAPASVFVPGRNRIYCFGGVTRNDGTGDEYHDDIFYVDLSPLTPSCSGRPDGAYPHPTNCAKFIRCWNEVMSLHMCPIPLLFNPAKSTCDYPNQVECGST